MFSLFLLIALAIAKESFTELSAFSLPSSSVSDNWSLLGSSSLLSSGNTLLTDSKASQGALWSKQSFSASEDWEISVEFLISGSPTEPSEGFMLALSETPGTIGTMFGTSEPFKGLAIIFDSTDNDKLKNNPAIAAHLFDGSQKYSHDDDGIQHQLAGCIVDYRNRPDTVKTKMVYESTSRRLSVFVDLLGRNKYQRCLVHSDVTLTASSYFIGLSAENRDSVDRYEIVSLKVLGGHAGAAAEDAHIGDNEDNLEEIDTIVHSKLDTLIRNAENSVNVHQLGQALDEIEINLIRHLNTKLSPVSQQMRRLLDRQETLNAGMETLRTVEIPKYDTTIMDIQRQIGEGQGEGTLDILKQIEDRIEQSVSREMSRIESEVQTVVKAKSNSAKSSGWSFWIMMLLFQVMFALVVAIQQLGTRRYGKLL